MIAVPDWDLTRWIIEVVGWGGALMILAGYILITTGKLTGRSLVYQMLNVFGAAGFVANGWWHGAIPSATLNIVWLLIGAIASWRIIRKRSSTSAT